MPWWGICLIFIIFWKDLADFLEATLPPVSWFHRTFPNGLLPAFCRVFRGECEIVHMTQQRHPVARPLKETVWNGGTPQQNLTSILVLVVGILGVSQYPSWRHPIRCKRSLNVHYLIRSIRVSASRRTYSAAWAYEAHLEPPLANIGVKDLGVVIFNGKNVENPWRGTQKLVYVGKVCVYTIM